MIFEDNYKLQIRDTRLNSEVTNKALLGIMENIAGMHSAKVGFGLTDIPKTNLTWILLDWKLEVKKRVKYGDQVHVKTWSRYIYKCYAYRDFEIYDTNQNLVAIATSKWVLIDVNKNRIIRVEDEVANKYESETDKSVFNIKELDKLKEPESFLSQVEYTVCRRDIDVYKHMHNLYYLDLAYEALPEDVYYAPELANVRITYKKEIKLGDKVNCKYTKENNKHIVIIRSENDKITHAIIELW